MTELEKLVQAWEKFKPIGTPHEHIWNGFIDDAKAAIEREKQALSIGDVVGRREQFNCGDYRVWGREKCKVQCNECKEGYGGN